MSKAKKRRKLTGYLVYKAQWPIATNGVPQVLIYPDETRQPWTCSFDYAIVAEGEGAGIAVGSGELHDHLHDFMCCCGKPWENCATDSVREDIARTDNPDEWTLDEQGREFSISWKYETGRTTVYRNYCGRCVISWQDPAMASSQEAATPECPGGDLCDGDLPGEWHEKSCPCYRDEVDGVMMRDWEARKPALQAEFDEWKSASRVAEPAPSPATKETPPINDELIAEIARELYDRFLMGGWEPQDAYPQIRTWLSYSSATPAKCEKCNAKSAKEACHMCIGGGGNCPIVDAGWVKDWPTQVEFEDAQTASSQGPAREETPTYPPQFPKETEDELQAAHFYETHDEYWIHPLAASTVCGDRDRATIRVHKAMAAFAAQKDAGAKSVVAAPQPQNVFTPQEVESLNGYQASGFMHPFTCASGNRCDDTHAGGGSLLATVHGWICPFCDYRQDWAHDFMKNGDWKKSFAVQRKALAGAAALPSAQNGWISVDSGKVPAHRTWVIGCVEHDGSRHSVPVYGVQPTKNSTFRWESEFPVTHWRELPSPPVPSKDKK